MIFHGTYAPAQARYRASEVADRWPERSRRFPDGVAWHWCGDASARKAANRQGHRHADGGRSGLSERDTGIWHPGARHFDAERPHEEIDTGGPQATVTRTTDAPRGRAGRFAISGRRGAPGGRWTTVGRARRDCPRRRSVGGQYGRRVP